MTVAVTQMSEDQAIGEGEEENNDPEKEDSPLSDDAPYVVLTFEVIRRGEVLTAQESIIGDDPPKALKSYNLRSKGIVLDAMLENKERALLRRILPPTNTRQPATFSPRGENGLSSNESPTSTKGDSSTPRNLSKGVIAKTTSAM